MTRADASAPGAPTPEERREMIAIAAYYLAEGRGFAPGAADLDWLRAEQVIDAMIADGQARASQSRGDFAEGIRNALKLSGGESRPA